MCRSVDSGSIASLQSIASPTCLAYHVVLHTYIWFLSIHSLFISYWAEIATFFVMAISWHLKCGPFLSTTSSSWFFLLASSWWRAKHLSLGVGPLPPHSGLSQLNRNSTSLYQRYLCVDNKSFTSYIFLSFSNPCLMSESVFRPVLLRASHALWEMILSLVFRFVTYWVEFKLMHIFFWVHVAFNSTARFSLEIRFLYIRPCRSTDFLSGRSCPFQSLWEESVTLPDH